MNENWLLNGLNNLIPLVLSLTVHEWAHAISAFKLGDDTAERQGRLTLNPMVHIDPIGTLLLPMMGVPFGWARPVPVNPVRFTRKMTMRTGMMLTAAAGPASNLVLALLCSLTFGLMLRFDVRNEAVEQLLRNGFGINIALAIFNMLPIPPLDGSRVMDWAMPLRLRPQWERLTRLGPVLLIGVIILPPLVGFSLLSWPMRMTYQLEYALLSAIVGG